MELEYSSARHDFVEKTLPLTYADRASMYDYEGENRGINVSIPTLAEREKLDPQMKELPDPANELPGTFNVAAPDGPEDEVGAGSFWGHFYTSLFCITLKLLCRSTAWALQSSLVFLKS